MTTETRTTDLCPPPSSPPELASHVVNVLDGKRLSLETYMALLGLPRSALRAA